jgi:hypothetical protein
MQVKGNDLILSSSHHQNTCSCSNDCYYDANLVPYGSALEDLGLRQSEILDIEELMGHFAFRICLKIVARQWATER